MWKSKYHMYVAEEARKQHEMFIPTISHLTASCIWSTPLGHSHYLTCLQEKVLSTWAAHEWMKTICYSRADAPRYWRHVVACTCYIEQPCMVWGFHAHGQDYSQLYPGKGIEHLSCQWMNGNDTLLAARGSMCLLDWNNPAWFWNFMPTKWIKYKKRSND